LSIRRKARWKRKTKRQRNAFRESAKLWGAQAASLFPTGCQPIATQRVVLFSN
jgi:hypothetical protein